jgi:hypothetical protein
MIRDPEDAMTDDGPFTDNMTRHFVLSVQTQHGIVAAAKEMAKILAEMGRASQKATGDPALFAVNKWAKIITDEAERILRGERAKQQDHVDPVGALKRLKYYNGE